MLYIIRLMEVVFIIGDHWVKNCRKQRFDESFWLNVFTSLYLYIRLRMAKCFGREGKVMNRLGEVSFQRTVVS